MVQGLEKNIVDIKYSAAYHKQGKKKVLVS